jgi:hypothetical protein
MSDRNTAKATRMAGVAAMTARGLRRDVIIVLAIKISIVLLAAFFVFSPRQRPLIDGNALDRQILNRSDR